MIPQSLSSSLSYLVPLQLTISSAVDMQPPWSYSVSLLSSTSLGSPSFSSFRSCLKRPWERGSKMESMQRQHSVPLHWSRSSCCPRRKDQFTAGEEQHRGNDLRCKGCCVKAAAVGNIAEVKGSRSVLSSG